MKKTWYNELGFHDNPFSIKPAAFTNDVFGNDKVIGDVVRNVNNSQIVFVHGPYGTGKTTLLKSLIEVFGGQKKVAYYHAKNADGDLDLDNILIRNRGFFGRLLGLRSKNMILLIDEAEVLTKKDYENILDYFYEGYFKSVVMIAHKNIRFPSDFEEEVDATYKLSGVDKTTAIELVRKRVGDINFLSDDIIRDVHDYGNIPRVLLKNLEDVCRHAYNEGAEEVKEDHVREVLGDKDDVDTSSSKKAKKDSKKKSSDKESKESKNEEE